MLTCIDASPSLMLTLMKESIKRLYDQNTTMGRLCSSFKDDNSFLRDVCLYGADGGRQ